MSLRHLSAIIPHLLIPLPMFFATYWSWMILTMLTGLSLLPIVVAFLITSVLATIFVAMIGAILDLRGHIGKTLIGACIGAAIGGVLFIPFLYHWLVLVFASLPTLGAIIAYHWSIPKASTQLIE